MSTTMERAADGFRRRGREVTRLETFVDAAFAFSLTLLVIVFDDLPDSVAELRMALRQVPTFAFCFVILAMFWAAHNRWSRRFGLDDARSTLLSLGFVFVVMIYVYPLRMVASGAMAFFTRGWAPAGYLLDPAHPMLDLQTMFMVYAVGFGTLSVLLWRLNAHALRQADRLGLDALERHETGNEIGVHVILASSALASLAGSLVMLVLYPPGRVPGWIASLPVWVYALIGPTIGLYMRRRARSLPVAA
ncbi:MAG TPA: TMEM175 family protein [Dokdonella sp.]